MTKYARIEASVVREFLETDQDLAELFPPDLIWVPCPDPLVAEGWAYVAGQYIAPPAPPDLRPQVWDEFRVRRDLYLSRLGEIAGRYSRRGDSAVPVAADAIADGLLNMPQDPKLAACPDSASLILAIVASANTLLKAQLTNPATAPGIKAALDKVFK